MEDEHMVFRNVDPIAHVINKPIPDVFCTFTIDDTVDVGDFFVTQHKEWHRVYKIEPYETDNWIGDGNPYGLTDYEEWYSYRNSLYDAVDQFLYDCDHLMGTQPFDKVDEQRMSLQLSYNRVKLIEYLDCMEEEMRKCRDACEPDTDIYSDYEEMYDWASTTKTMLCTKRIRIKSGPIRLPFDFIF